MKLFKDEFDVVFAYEEDGSQDHLIGDKTPITQEEADELSNQKWQDEFDGLTYAQKRFLEYPDFRDYLDGIVKNDSVQIQKYIDDCLAVKAKYPKPEAPTN